MTSVTNHSSSLTDISIQKDNYFLYFFISERKQFKYMSTSNNEDFKRLAQTTRKRHSINQELTFVLVSIYHKISNSLLRSHDVQNSYIAIYDNGYNAQES